MLGILLIYFIGRYLYKLAEEFNKNRWLFAILGVVIYYVGTFFGGIIIAILDELFMFGLNWENDLILAIIALPFGLGLVYLFHYLLKKKWEKSVIIETESIEDIGKSIEEIENNN